MRWTVSKIVALVIAMIYIILAFAIEATLRLAQRFLPGPFSRWP
jgi:hypothetical protein